MKSCVYCYDLYLDDCDVIGLTFPYSCSNLVFIFRDFRLSGVGDSVAALTMSSQLEIIIFLHVPLLLLSELSKLDHLLDGGLGELGHLLDLWLGVFKHLLDLAKALLDPLLVVLGILSGSLLKILEVAAKLVEATGHFFTDLSNVFSELVGLGDVGDAPDEAEPAVGVELLPVDLELRKLGLRLEGIEIIGISGSQCLAFGEFFSGLIHLVGRARFFSCIHIEKAVLFSGRH